MAGVGATNTLTFLIIQVSLGLAAGFTVSAAQLFGAGDTAQMKKHLGNGLVLSLLISVASAVLLASSSRNILSFLNTPEEITGYADVYIRILFIGIPATVLYNYLAAALRALGDSRTPVLMLVIASFLNIGLDLFLILVAGMGVGGAALATILSEAVSAVLCIVYIAGKAAEMHLQREDLGLKKSIVLTLLKNGIPLALTSSVTAIGLAAVQAAVNGMGTVYVAATAAADKLYGVIAAPFSAFESAAASFVAQNIGAGNRKRAGKGVLWANILSFTFSGIMLLFTFLAGRYLVMIFVDAARSDVIDAAYALMLSWAMFFVCLSIQQNLSNALQGMGFAALNIFSGLLEVAGRCAASFLFVSVWGFTGICFAVPLAWVLASAFLVPVYLICSRKKETKRTLSLQYEG